ncbi:hypothetical protein [Pseudoflavitalea rhizosphaerae]|nr:hypothetical protein [Pseudoflavitalea rhizosphaerae]
MQQLVNFDKADNDFDPICLKEKRWELIRYGLVEAVNTRKP